MWEVYKKRLPVMQLSIVVLCAILYFALKLPWHQVLACFVFFQICAVAGAWWGTRIRRKIEKSDDELPLKR